MSVTPRFLLFTRDIVKNRGLLCQHCGATAVEFSDIAEPLRSRIEAWAEEYTKVHAVAHYDENQLRATADYDHEFEKAATEAETYLQLAARELLPPFLDSIPPLSGRLRTNALRLSRAISSRGNRRDLVRAS